MLSISFPRSGASSEHCNDSENFVEECSSQICSVSFLPVFSFTSLTRSDKTKVWLAKRGKIQVGEGKMAAREAVLFT